TGSMSWGKLLAPAIRCIHGREVGWGSPAVVVGSVTSLPAGYGQMSLQLTSLASTSPLLNKKSSRWSLQDRNWNSPRSGVDEFSGHQRLWPTSVVVIARRQSTPASSSGTSSASTDSASRRCSTSIEPELSTTNRI